MGWASAAGGLRALGRGTLLLLAALLPFEGLEPLARLGPLQLSSVELFLYLALATWGAAAGARFLAGERDVWARLRGAPRAHRAVALFALVVFASAVLAPASRGPAVKFALRSAGGMLLYLAAADLLRAPGAVARTARALVGGALMAALLVIGETRVRGLAPALRPFHLQTFEALGVPRASGPFQYPNIAAMYLEAVAPLVLALAAAAGRPAERAGQGPATPRAQIALATLALFVLLEGVLATGSRAGLGAAIVVVTALGLWCARAAASRAAAVASLAAVAVVIALASGSALAGRFQFWKDGGWYRAVITQVGAPAARGLSMAPAQEASETLELRNEGALAWRRDAPTPVRLSYHWLDHGRVVVFDGRRTVLPADVPPGGRVRVEATVRAPAVPGVYTLWWDLVHEHTSWFSERGNPGLRETVVVAASGRDRGPGTSPRAALPDRPAPAAVPGVPEPAAGALMRADDGAVRMPRGTLWRGAVVAWRTRPLLGIGPDNFRHLAALFVHRSDTDPRMHANSLYFETLADLGLVGLLAFAGVIVALAGTARRALDSPAARLLALGVGAALGTFLLHGVLDYFFEFTPTYGLFWLLAGMIVAMQREPEAAR